MPDGEAPISTTPPAPRRMARLDREIAARERAERRSLIKQATAATEPSPPAAPSPLFGAPYYAHLGDGAFVRTEPGDIPRPPKTLDLPRPDRNESRERQALLAEYKAAHTQLTHAQSRLDALVHETEIRQTLTPERALSIAHDIYVIDTKLDILRSTLPSRVQLALTRHFQAALTDMRTIGTHIHPFLTQS